MHRDRYIYRSVCNIVYDHGKIGSFSLTLSPNLRDLGSGYEDVGAEVLLQMEYILEHIGRVRLSEYRKAGLKEYQICWSLVGRRAVSGGIV